MREVTVYYAFDDKRFEDKKECLTYEEKVYNYMMEIISSFIFYDENKKKINHYFEDLNGVLSSFDWAWQNCEYIDNIVNCSKESLEFIREYFGYPLPNEIGLNEYDWVKQKWVKVDE